MHSTSKDVYYYSHFGQSMNSFSEPEGKCFEVYLPTACVMVNLGCQLDLESTKRHPSEQVYEDGLVLGGGKTNLGGRSFPRVGISFCIWAVAQIQDVQKAVEKVFFVFRVFKHEKLLRSDVCPSSC